MKGSNSLQDQATEPSAANARHPDSPAPAPVDPAPTKQRRIEARRWWIKLCIQPAMMLAVCVLAIVLLGAAQRMGWISAGGREVRQAAASDGNVRYICPMMCTPPQSEPGRCPVCAMELVPATSGDGDSSTMSVQIDASARRVANIRTVAVQAVPMTQTIRAIGELTYDEGTLKTLSAYVDGRLDKLYADYTGVVVHQGDHLALLYSPKLYSGQHEFLLSKKARDEGPTTTLARVVETRRELYESARQRLLELGMTQRQIDLLEQEGKANSRLHLCAPISGTVIEKLAVEGQYVKEGQPIYKLADLSAVWLMLELFPEDAARIRYGQKVEAEVQSLPGEKFSGRVVFVDPVVDPNQRTVGVRVVMANEDGRLRIGDYAKAAIDVVAGGMAGTRETLYDPELAGKFIGPRHPHVVESSPGKCRICGAELVPASQFGYADQPIAIDQVLAVPRNAVLMAGSNSVVYVETEPGRFEIRRVVLGPSRGDEIVILKGVAQGEMVAASGNFLLDSQMQLAGNPSLIDPTKFVPNEHGIDPETAAKIEIELAKLPEADRALCRRQKICPVSDLLLGAMGAPEKVDVNGTPVFICCHSCRDSLLEEPEKYLAKLAGKPVPADAPPAIPQADLPELVWPPIGIPESERHVLEQIQDDAVGQKERTAEVELPKETVK